MILLGLDSHSLLFKTTTSVTMDEPMCPRITPKINIADSVFQASRRMLGVVSLQSDTRVNGTGTTDVYLIDDEST